MGHIIETGEKPGSLPSRGFTLVELLIVLLLIALLASLVMPVATRSVEQAKESALKEDLHVMRKAIDDFYANTGHYPQSLAQLVEKRYIHLIPVDPLLDHAKSWIEISAGEPGGGISDVHSGAEGNDSDGKPYRDW
jgi:general secretion pathway protein G